MHIRPLQALKFTKIYQKNLVFYLFSDGIFQKQKHTSTQTLQFSSWL